MTEDDRIDAVRVLLTQAESAHAEYEATALQGVYDQEWPRWYAAYAVDHGIEAIVGPSVTTDRLAEFLAATNAEFQRIAPTLTEPTPTEPWAAYTARRIIAEL